MRTLGKNREGNKKNGEEQNKKHEESGWKKEW